MADDMEKANISLLRNTNIQTRENKNVTNDILQNTAPRMHVNNHESIIFSKLGVHSAQF